MPNLSIDSQENATFEAKKRQPKFNFRTLVLYDDVARAWVRKRGHCSKYDEVPRPSVVQRRHLRSDRGERTRRRGRGLHVCRGGELPLLASITDAGNSEGLYVFCLFRPFRDGLYDTQLDDDILGATYRQGCTVQWRYVGKIARGQVFYCARRQDVAQEMERS